MKITVIGGGNMGEAIIAGIHKQYAVTVCEKDASKARSLRQNYNIEVADLETAVKNCEIVLLAVKPQDFDAVLSQIKEFISKKLVISIAAGVTTLYIEKKLGGKVKVIRTMPNLPAQVGEAVTAISKGKEATERDLELASCIFNAIGKTVVVEEKFIDAVTALSGSGPAYVFLFVECLEKAANELGLNEPLSKELVRETLRGSLALLEKSGEEAGVLRQKVTSKGGTTQAAMDVFLKHKIEEVFKEALLAAKKRAGELSK